MKILFSIFLIFILTQQATAGDSSEDVCAYSQEGSHGVNLSSYQDYLAKLNPIKVRKANEPSDAESTGTK